MAPVRRMTRLSREGPTTFREQHLELDASSNIFFHLTFGCSSSSSDSHLLKSTYTCNGIGSISVTECTIIIKRDFDVSILNGNKGAVYFETEESSLELLA